MSDSSSPLLSVSEAKKQLLNVFHPLSTEKIHFSLGANRILAAEVKAPFDFPLFENSSMDGYAVIAEDVETASENSPVLLEVAFDIPAGVAVKECIHPGQAARIMTGAVLPGGANAVVPVEGTDVNWRGQPDFEMPSRIKVYQSVERGAYVRPAGQDISAGEMVLTPGPLRSQEIGVLAMLGIEWVQVYRRPRVAVMSTGDELLQVGQPLVPGKIFDSNSHVLGALVSQYGGEPVHLGTIRDDQHSVKVALDHAVEQDVDLILSSAGVSVGAFDYVRTVVETHGSLGFWRVNMRPGKPLAFGNYQGVPFIGLPGNPVSAFVGFEVFVRPAIQKMSGLQTDSRPVARVRMLEDVESDGRESYLRAVVSRQENQLVARLTGHQGSGNLRSLVQANALLIVPSGVKSLPSGATVDAWLFTDDIGG